MTIEGIAEKACEDICNIMPTTEDEYVDGLTRVVKAAIREATEAQRQEIERLEGKLNTAADIIKIMHHEKNGEKYDPLMFLP